MQILFQLVFIIIVIAAVFLFSKKINEIRRNILLGRDENYRDHAGLRWKNMLLLALGQKKMFRNPLVALLHLFVYAGFIIINIEVLEIALDGLFGTHRIFAPYMGGLYGFLINSFEFCHQKQYYKILFYAMFIIPPAFHFSYINDLPRMKSIVCSDMCNS